MAKIVIWILGKETKDDHSTSAKSIAGNYNRKTNGKYVHDTRNNPVKVIDSPDEFQKYLNNPDNNDVVKIYVLSHGNQGGVEGQGKDEWYNGAGLAKRLWKLGLQRLTQLHRTEPIKVTLLTCESGSLHPNRNTIFAEQVASAFRRYKGTQGRRTIIVKGMAGLSFTTNQGKNVVYDGTTHHTEVNNAFNKAGANLDTLKKQNQAIYDVIMANAEDRATSKPTFRA